MREEKTYHEKERQEEAEVSLVPTDEVFDEVEAERGGISDEVRQQTLAELGIDTQLAMALAALKDLTQAVRDGRTLTVNTTVYKKARQVVRQAYA